MKRLMQLSLSVILLSAASATAVFAETPTNPPTRLNGTSTSSQQITPFDLVSMAYQGRFKDWGIPSAQALLNAYRSGDVTAKDLVSSAIQSNYLSTSVMADDDYLSAVDLQLRSLNNNNPGLGR